MNPWREVRDLLQPRRRREPWAQDRELASKVATVFAPRTWVLCEDCRSFVEEKLVPTHVEQCWFGGKS